MCEYCKTKQKDFRCERLIEESVSLGAAGNLDVDVALGDERYFETEIGIAKNLHIALFIGEQSEPALDKFFKIIFCPMCGRKLGEEKENV